MTFIHTPWTLLRREKTCRKVLRGQRQISYIYMCVLIKRHATCLLKQPLIVSLIATFAGHMFRYLSWAALSHHFSFLHECTDFSQCRRSEVAAAVDSLLYLQISGHLTGGELKGQPTRGEHLQLHTGQQTLTSSVCSSRAATGNMLKKKELLKQVWELTWKIDHQGAGRGAMKH